MSPADRLYLRVRRAVRAQPDLYRAQLRMSGVNVAAYFPDSACDLHIAGYGRGANSFTHAWLRRLAPELRIASHVHAVATVKLAFRYEVPVMR